MDTESRFAAIETRLIDATSASTEALMQVGSVNDRLGRIEASMDEIRRNAVSPDEFRRSVDELRRAVQNPVAQHTPAPPPQSNGRDSTSIWFERIALSAIALLLGGTSGAGIISAAADDPQPPAHAAPYTPPPAPHPCREYAAPPADSYTPRLD